MGKAIFYERDIKMLVRVGGTTLQSQIFGRTRKIFFVRPQKVPKICIFLQKKAHFSTKKKQNRSVTLFSSLLAIV